MTKQEALNLMQMQTDKALATFAQQRAEFERKIQAQAEEAIRAKYSK